jgi:hypothetical protein
MATFDEQNVPGYFGIFSMPSVPHSLVETHSAKHPCVDRATLQVGFQIWIRSQQCIYSSKTIQVFPESKTNCGLLPSVVSSNWKHIGNSAV